MLTGEEARVGVQVTGNDVIYRAKNAKDALGVEHGMLDAQKQGRGDKRVGSWKHRQFGFAGA